MLTAGFPHCACVKVRLELTEEYEQVKAIVATLESFRSEKPSDIMAPLSEEKPGDPAIWPPPIPAEHRCVSASWLISTMDPGPRCSHLNLGCLAKPSKEVSRLCVCLPAGIP